MIRGWYTGASGWMYKVGLENILGLKRIQNKGYKITPCVPDSWNEYEINIFNNLFIYNPLKIKFILPFPYIFFKQRYINKYIVAYILKLNFILF